MGDIPATPTPEAGKPTPEAHSSPVIGRVMEPYIFVALKRFKSRGFVENKGSFGR